MLTNMSPFVEANHSDVCVESCFCYDIVLDVGDFAVGVDVCQ